ncbi:hypothetical protein YC2023_018371 [Brassica napus]
MLKILLEKININSQKFRHTIKINNLAICFSASRLGDFKLHSSPRKKANESTTKSTDYKLQRVHCYKKI